MKDKDSKNLSLLVEGLHSVNSGDSYVLLKNGKFIPIPNHDGRISPTLIRLICIKGYEKKGSYYDEEKPYIAVKATKKYDAALVTEDENTITFYTYIKDDFNEVQMQGIENFCAEKPNKKVLFKYEKSLD